MSIQYTDTFNYEKMLMLDHLYSRHSGILVFPFDVQNVSISATSSHDDFFVNNTDVARSMSYIANRDTK